MRSLAVVVTFAVVFFVATAFAAEEEQHDAQAGDNFVNTLLMNRVKRQYNPYQTQQYQQQYQQQQYQQPYYQQQYYQQARCNPCYYSAQSNQWCTRDPSCNPAPAYCTVICGMPSASSGSCDWTVQCSKVIAGSERVASSVVGIIMASLAAAAAFFL